MTAVLQRELKALMSLTGPQLRQRWRKEFRASAPVCFTNDLLVRGLAYRLQEQIFGHLPAQVERDLENAAKPPEKRTRASQLRSGNRLIRRWRGHTYVVDVEDCAFVFEQKRYASLTEIACLITGTRWSGPRFFGLQAKP